MIRTWCLTITDPIDKESYSFKGCVLYTFKRNKNGRSIKVYLNADSIKRSKSVLNNTFITLGQMEIT